ncbi:cysteine desulfurase family protein [Citricoccus nitrophenolicus]|uniref:Cysteine desulfurase family protein n=1 Tax=Citricoccus nitrophenolicus TaxID=863575 RepID=A0ABV0IN05_9MICC|nr:cysteine desulfurase family protein [Citricoccus sp. I39-566]WMY77741.1 cysteine desulfurase family protein [Citricoccus sp. I39-566]
MSTSEPRNRVYLDHAATTAIRPVALDAFTSSSLTVGNQSSLHQSGRGAKLRVETARDALAAAVGAHPSEVVFTSGGTESDNLALKGLYWARRDATRAAGRPECHRIVLTGMEHHAILDTATWLETHEGAQLDFVPVHADGMVDLEAWRQTLSREPETIAVATLMWVNNEIGTVQPVSRAAAIAAEYGVPFHTDAVQALGTVPVDFPASGATTLAVSGHKIGAPVGVGALLVRRDATLTPVQHGGGQERDIRSGTIPAALIEAFAAAATEARAHLDGERERLGSLRDRLIEGIRELIPEARLTGPEDLDPQTGERLPAGTRRSPGNAHFIFPGCEGDSILFGLDMVGVEASTGSACSAGVPRPSHVLLTLGVDEDQARSVQRFSLGHTSTAADVEQVLSVLPEVHASARRAGMAGHTSTIRTANSTPVTSTPTRTSSSTTSKGDLSV